MLLDRLKATGCIFALFLGVFAFASAAQAGPEDGRIVDGSGSISQSGTHTDIHQNSDFLSTRWGSFNIAANESVQAHQPGASSRLLIRVDGGGATNIAGSYTSNGITILENQNGVQFSRGAIVNVGGLLATSSRISGVAGANWQLDGTGGAVVNHGAIVAGAGGAILAAVKIQNTGDITAKGGDVALGAGSSFTVDFAGSMVGFEITQAASGASITTTGKIEAQGGVVSLSAREAQAVRTNVVSVGGVVKATKLERRGGVVYLSGGEKGIAEVSGDVSASKKVQTTGEYVVVKEGALLKAPEILVGGDFQGKGDVPTARRTLVERGALLDADANGRVIVWSDETTWFNGDISAPEGFAEVSGKQTLASVNLAGIDVGELLLDPDDIIIAASGDVVRGNILADASGTTLTLGVDSINRITSNLRLAASNTITVNVAINKPMGGLTLTAGGVLTLNDNINTGTGDLTLSGRSIVLSTPVELRGAAITLTGAIDESGAGGNDSLTVTTRTGALTLNDNINTGTGALSLSGASILLNENGDAIYLIGGAVTLTGAIDGDQDDTNDNDFTIAASGGLTLNSNINLGTGDLVLRTRSNIVTNGTPTLTASTVRLEQSGGTFADDLFTLASVTSLGLRNFRTAQTVHGWMIGMNRDLILTANGNITISGNIDIGTGNLSLTAGGGIGSRIVATGTPTLTASTVRLGQLSAFAETAPFMFADSVTSLGLTIFLAAQTVHGWMIGMNRDLSIAARGDITVSGNVDIGTGNLTLVTIGIHGISTHNIVAVGTPTLTASTVTLQQDGTFADDLFTLASATSLDLRTRRAAQTMHGWMVASDRDLSIAARGDITVSGNVDIGTGNLTLWGNIVATGTPTLTASTVSLTQGGAFAETALFMFADSVTSLTLTTGAVQTVHGWMAVRGRDLSITASGVGGIMVSGNIDIGTGNLSLLVSNFRSNIVAIGRPTLTAGTVSLRQTGAFAETAPFMFSTSGLILMTRAEQTVYDWMVVPGRDLSLRAVNDITVSGDIDVGSAILNLEVDDGNIVAVGTPKLTAGTVSLRQVHTFRSNAPFMFAANTLALTVGGRAAQTVYSWMVADGRSLSITAGRDIRVSGAIDVGTGALTLTAGMSFGIGNIMNGGTAHTLTASTVSLTQDRAFGPDAPFTFGSVGTPVGALNLTTDNAQTVYSWMVDPGRSLSVTSTGRAIIVNADIVTSTGDLTLNGNMGIVLGGTAPITLDGGDITLTGAIDESGARGNDALTITATGDITINDDINLGPDGELTLFAGMGGSSSNRRNILSDPDNTETLTAGTVSLRQDDAFGNTFAGPTGTFRISTSTLNLRASDLQPVHNWMVVLNRSLSVTSGRPVEVGEDIVLGTGDLTLRGRLIAINGARTLSGGAISLEGRIESFGSAITITATGALTLNDNINTDTVDHTGTGDLALSGGSIVLGGTAPITLDGGAITLTGAIDESSTGNDVLTVTATGDITINDDINLGTGALSLFGASIALGSRVSSLVGGAITLVGAITRTSTVGLTLTANGRLTLNSGINLGTGILTINAGERINISTANTAITAGTFTINFTDSDGATNEHDGFSIDGGTTTTRGNLTGIAPTTITFAALAVDCITGTGACLLETEGNANLVTADANLASDTSITISIGSGTLTFGGSGAITIEAPIVSIRAGNIDIGNRGLTITASTGALTLVTHIFTEGALTLSGGSIVLGGTAPITLSGAAITLTGAIISTGSVVALTVTAIGQLVLNNSIHIGTGALSLTAASIRNGGVKRTLTAGTVSLVQVQGGTFADDLFVIASATSLTLTTGAAQTVHGWMVGGTNRALSITTTGVLTIGRNINTGTSNLTLSGLSGISINGARTLRGAAITLIGEILRAGNAALVITATGGALTFNSSFNTGTGALTLSGTSIVLGGTAPITLSGGAVTLTGAATGAANLTITASSTLRLNNNITLTGTSILDLRSRQGAITGSAILIAPTVRLRQVAAFAEDALFTFGSATGSLLLITDANQDVRDWMISPGINLTVRSSRRVRVMGAAIGSGSRNLGGGDLTLRSTGGVVRILENISTTGSLTLIGPGTIVGTGMPLLTASTVSLSQADAFAAARSFGLIADSLEFTTTVNQDVHNWMIREDTNLTVTSSNRVRVVAIIGTGGAAGRNLGNGSITLTSTGGAVRILANITTTGNITLSGGTGGINFNSGAGAKTLSGAAITLSGNALSNRDLTLDATTDALRVENNITLTGTSNLTLMSATVVRIFADISTGGDITLSGGTIGINFNNRGAKTLSGAAIMLTGAAVSNRDLTLIASGTLTLNSNIIATGTSALSLSGSSGITLGAEARTITGRAITLRGAATGTADLTLTASGTLTISNDITLTGDGLTLTLSGGGAISNGGNVGANRPLLTAGTVSFRQDAAFATTGPFRFGSATGSLVFTTTVNQDVHNWMIRENTNLTVTSSDRVRVLAAIGAGARNLGNGSLTLTSTGRIVRIVADISTTGDATITASGILTINNNINIGTGALILEATSFDFGSNVNLAAGSHSFTPNMTCNTGTSPSCTVNTP